MAKIEYCIEVTIAADICNNEAEEDTLVDDITDIAGVNGELVRGEGQLDLVFYLPDRKRAREIGKKIKRRFKKVSVNIYSSEC
jgi:hypothetical protein